MKAIIKFIFILTVIQSSQFSIEGQNLSPEVSRRVLFSIGKDEKPVFNESSIILSSIGSDVTVLTSDEESRIYVYENGKKRGPFKDITGTGVKKYEDNPEEYDPVFRKESDADYEKYLEYNDAGEVTLKFNGKTFGPFQFILEFYSTSDKTSFCAIVMKESKPLIITSSGKSYDLDGQPGYNYISPTGKKMMVTTIKENDKTGETLNKDLPVKSREEITKSGKEILEIQKSKSPEAYIYFQDGNKFGPYDPKSFTPNNPAFSKTGGDNWLLTIDSKLYINGKAIKDLDNVNISPANIWLTEDAKRYAILVYNRIEFHDGSLYKDPLKMRITVNKNKITIWWLMLENEKDIVLYSKIL
jgi:hypothetical protein